MNAVKVIADILKFTKEEQAQPEFKEYVLSLVNRYYSNDWILYRNGNAICEINKCNGTHIRTILVGEEYKPEFPETIDVEISKRCQMGCKFCYANCTPDGKDADFDKFLNDKNSFLYSLHEGTEVALNGNEPLHPDLEKLLLFFKERNIIANLTVNEVTLLLHKDLIFKWLNDGLIHGLGVSPKNYSKELIELCQKSSRIVLHTIAGITTQTQYKKLYNKDLKILILGYKNLGRGVGFKITNNRFITHNIEAIKENLNTMINSFKVVSFDNLAIKQLDIKSFLTPEQWDLFYRGDDGSHSCFINMVTETFAQSSLEPQENHKPLLNDIRDILKVVRDEKLSQERSEITE